MHSEFSIRNQSCPNPSCVDRHKIGQGNIAIHSRKEGRMRCTKCGITWVSHRTTMFYRLKKDHGKFEQAILLLNRGIPAASIARSVGVSLKTIQRWKKRTRTSSNISNS